MRRSRFALAFVLVGCGGGEGSDTTSVVTTGITMGDTGEGDGGEGDATTAGDGDGSTSAATDTTGTMDTTSTSAGDGDGDTTTTSTTGPTSTTTSTTGDGDGDPDVPNNAYCTGAANWNTGYASLEVQVLDLVNQYRASGYNCASGYQSPAPPVTMHPALRCSSRLHSRDMAVNDYFDHNNLMGESPFDRMAMAGYSYTTAGENIAAGNSSAAATVDQWLGSTSGHCENMMNPSFDQLGVGYYAGGSYGHYWTQNFGAN